MNRANKKRPMPKTVKIMQRIRTRKTCQRRHMFPGQHRASKPRNVSKPREATPFLRISTQPLSPLGANEPWPYLGPRLFLSLLILLLLLAKTNKKKTAEELLSGSILVVVFCVSRGKDFQGASTSENPISGEPTNGTIMSHGWVWSGGYSTGEMGASVFWEKQILVGVKGKPKEPQGTNNMSNRKEKTELDLAFPQADACNQGNALPRKSVVRAHRRRPECIERIRRILFTSDESEGHSTGRK